MFKYGIYVGPDRLLFAGVNNVSWAKGICITCLYAETSIDVVDNETGEIVGHSQYGSWYEGYEDWPEPEYDKCDEEP